jgi:hypothetical protein
VVVRGTRPLRLEGLAEKGFGGGDVTLGLKRKSTV